MISGTFFTQSEAMEIWGKDRKTVYRWMQKGKFKFEKVGNMVLISEDEVKRLQAELGA